MRKRCRVAENDGSMAQDFHPLHTARHLPKSDAPSFRYTSSITLLPKTSTGSERAMDDFVWKHHCERLCQGKMFSLHVLNMPKYDLYKKLEQESRRTSITVDDLCRNAWKFRFKQSAGEYWKSCDPYWHGQPPMKRVFHNDGFISAEPDDLVWGGHECCWSLISPDDGQGETLVQINSWPALSVSRTPTWSWKMENSFVVYYSEEMLQTPVQRIA